MLAGVVRGAAIAVFALGIAVVATSAFADKAVNDDPESTSSKTVFITSQMFDGALGGLEGADDKCNQAAAAAGLSGTFKAWLSNSSTGPADRFVRAELPYVRTDGVRIADHWTDLVTCDQGPGKKECLDAPLKVDENGSHLGGFLLQAWSSTGADGTPGTLVMGPVVNCADWTKSDPVVELMGATGQARLMGLDQLDPDWTGVTGVAGCYVPLHLYCFEQ
jgi:hypothetical protein